MFRNVCSGLIKPPIYSLCTLDGVKILANYGAPSSLSSQFPQPVYGINQTTTSLLKGTAIPHFETGFVSVRNTSAIAACHFLESVFGLKLQVSSGANFYASLDLIETMRLQEIKGSIVFAAADSKANEHDTIYQDAWLKKQKIDIWPELHRMLNLYFNYSDEKPIKRSPRITTCGSSLFYTLPAEKRAPVFVVVDEEKSQVKP